MGLFDRLRGASIPSSVDPPVPRKHLSVRDQTRLCVFYGVYLGVEHGRYPELTSMESLGEEVLQRFNAAPDAQFWSLLRFDCSRSGYVNVPSWGLVLTPPRDLHRESAPGLLGTWSVDGRSASAENAGVMTLTAALLASPTVSAEAEAERAALAQELQHDGLLGPLGWHAISGVALKHT
jgi:hypothetical protein